MATTERLTSHVQDVDPQCTVGSGHSYERPIPLHDRRFSVAGPSFHTYNTDNRYPLLRKTLLHLYKGRPLVQDESKGVTRFIDDAGVFVGRLCKTQETTASLLQRFQKYGNIVGQLLGGHFGL